MKRFCLFLPITFLLFSCAQMFDANLYDSFDNPPPLKASDLSAKSVNDLSNLVNNDPSFLEALKNDSAALEAVQDVLETAFTPALATAAKTGTAAEKAAVVDSAQAYLTATAYGTDAGEVANEAIQQASNLISGGTPATAIKALTAGKSKVEIVAILTAFQQMDAALHAMQVAATVGTVINTTTFWGNCASKGDLAQNALVAASATALIADNTDIDTLATKLAAGTTLSATVTEINKVTAALGGTVDATSNPYAYLNAVTDILPF